MAFHEATGYLDTRHAGLGRVSARTAIQLDFFSVEEHLRVQRV